jgi:hypothetical protein
MFVLLVGKHRHLTFIRSDNKYLADNSQQTIAEVHFKASYLRLMSFLITCARNTATFVTIFMEQDTTFKYATFINQDNEFD